MFSERPFADGRPAAFFVFNALRADAGRLTQQWLARVRAFDAGGWATHAVLVNKDAHLGATLTKLRKSGRLPAATQAHHYVLRDRRIRPAWTAPLPPDGNIDARVGDWLDWLTGQVPGAVVLADSPAAYPYLAQMTNPLASRVAVVRLSHLAPGADPSDGELAPRFADRFAGQLDAFDAIVTETQAQSDDIRTRFGAALPTVVIPPFLEQPTSAPAHAVDPDAAARRATILSIGPLDSDSAHGQVLAALPDVLAEQPQALVRVSGSGSEEVAEGLRRQAADLGVADRVTIVPGAGLDRNLADAGVLVWSGAHESWPLGLARAAAAGVPVVARDVRYGPREIVTHPQLGELVGTDAPLAPAISAALARWSRPGADVQAEVRAAARPLLRRVDRHEVGTRWTSLGRKLVDDVRDQHTPSLLVETITTNMRTIRLPGVLSDAPSDLSAWSCELPGLTEPAGWLIPAPVGVADETDAARSAKARAGGATREVHAFLRTHQLAFFAVEANRPVRVEFTDGSTVVPLLTTGFDDRIIAARVGNATLRRDPDGTVWTEPLPELVLAHNVEGRIVVRAKPDAPVSDVTHAVSWSVDIDWADMRATADGAAFTGVLRATHLAPADDSAPAICVTDVGGFSRVVGQLHYTGAPRIDGLEWSADVRGVLATEPLIATTELARGALALHVGLPGLLVPIGSLWTYGRRERIPLESPRGMVTLLPSSGGRVIAASGRGLVARATSAVRGVVTRG